MKRAEAREAWRYGIRTGKIEEVVPIRKQILYWKQPTIKLDHKLHTRHFVVTYNNTNNPVRYDAPGEIIGIGSVGVDPLELDSLSSNYQNIFDQPIAFRLYAGAIDSQHRKQGLYSWLFNYRVDYAKNIGANGIWTKSRYTTWKIFESKGFSMLSDVFVDENTQAETRLMGKMF